MDNDGSQGESGSSRQGKSGAAERTTPGAAHADVIFGIEPVREMVAAQPAAIVALYVRARDARRFADEIAQVQQAGGKINRVDDAELARAAGSAQARHQGLVAVVQSYRYEDLQALIAAGPEVIVLVDGVTDPRNLGAILRSVECAGFKAVIIARDRTAAVTPAVIKTSAGAWAHLKIARCGNVVRTLQDLKSQSYWIAALTPQGKTSIYDLDAQGRLVVVVGAEGEGLRPLVLRQADYDVSIPLFGQVKSLNVSVAAAVALFEIKRRRESLLGVLTGMRE